jgi:hypothetical protein
MGINDFKNYKLYKILSIVGYLEFIIIPLNLLNIYLFENPHLKPSGTIFVGLCLAILLFPLNLLLAGGLYAEKRLRKEVINLERKSITNIGFYIYIFNTIIGFFVFLLAVYLFIR